MNIVETYANPKNINWGNTPQIIACKNIVARLNQIEPIPVLLPHVDDYGHGKTSYIDYQGINIMVHQYEQVADNNDTVIQYELSIEY